MQKDIALVLAGGGGRGAYQIGAWRALRELGLDKRIGAVAGTSIGALNGALFAQGRYETARQVWLSLNSDRVLTIEHQPQVKNPSMLEWFKQVDIIETLKDGVFSRQGLLDIIDEHADLKKISGSALPVFAACCQLPTLRTVYFKLNGKPPEAIIQILLASSAIPVVFDMVEIDGETYVDGGVTDNVPVRPLYDAGFRKFIVIHLERKDLKLKKKFPGAEINEVIPSQDLGNVITGMLDFSVAGARYRMNLGYQDAIASLEGFSLRRKWARQVWRWLDKVSHR